MDQKIQDLEEQKETLVLDLETTKNKLLDLESIKAENERLQKEMKEQRELMTDNVGEEAQGLSRYNPIPRRAQNFLVPIGVVVCCYFLHDWFNSW